MEAPHRLGYVRSREREGSLGEEDEDSLPAIEINGAEETAPMAVSSWPDGDLFDMSSSPAASSFPSLFRETPASTSRASSEAASPFGRSYGLSTPPAKRQRLLDGASGDAKTTHKHVVAAQQPIHPEVLSRWPCTKWPSKVFFTHMYPCITDPLNLSYFVMQFVAFNHPCCMWRNDTPLELEVKKLIVKRASFVIGDGAGSAPGPGDVDSVSAIAHEVLSSFLSNAEYNPDKIRRRSFMFRLFGEHVSFADAFSSALASMSTASLERHDINVSGLADYLLDDSSWLIHFPLFATESRQSSLIEAAFSVNAFSFFVKGVVGAAEFAAGSQEDGSKSLLAVGVILFFSMWSSHVPFSASAQRMKLMWSTVHKLYDTSGYTLRSVLTRPSVITMLLIQCWRSYMLRLLRTSLLSSMHAPSPSLSSSLASLKTPAALAFAPECVRALNIFGSIDMRRPTVDELAQSTEDFFVWTCETLVRNVSDWCGTKDDLAGMGLSHFEPSDGSTRKFMKSLLVAKRVMVRIDQMTAPLS